MGTLRPRANRTDETAPFTRARTVSPSNTTDVPGGLARAIYVGTPGDLSVITEGGDTITFMNLPAGFMLPGYVTRVRATGTTAADLVALT